MTYAANIQPNTQPDTILMPPLYRSEGFAEDLQDEPTPRTNRASSNTRREILLLCAIPFGCALLGAVLVSVVSNTGLV